MSTSDDTTLPNAGKTADQDTVIEAEIVSDPNDVTDSADADEANSNASKRSGNSHPPKATKKGGKMGWLLSGLLAAFIGGVFAAPYAERSLVQMGLLPDQPRENQGANTADTSEAIQALQAAIDGLRAEQAELANSMNTQPSSDAFNGEAANRLTRLEDDVARFAAIIASTDEPNSDASVDNLRAEIARLSDDIARLSGMAAAGTPGLDAVNSSMAILRAEARQLRGDVTALREALAAMQAGSIESSPRGRLLLALGRVEDLALTGQNFAAELESLRADAATLPVLDQQKIGAELAVMEQHVSGIIPLQNLMRGFPDAATAAKQASEKEDGSFLASLFTVRRTDGSAEGIDATLLSAEKRLLLGDVAGAAETMNTLEGAALIAAQAWISDANAHAATIQAFKGFRGILARSDLPNAGGGA